LDNQNLNDPGKIIELVSQRTERERRLYSPDNPSPTEEQSSISSQDVLTYIMKNEVGDAQLFIRLFRDKYRFDRNAGEWYVWAGHSWEKDRQGRVMEDLNDVILVYVLELKRLKVRRMQAENDAEQKKIDNHRNEIHRRLRALQSLKRRKNVLELAGAGLQSLAVTGFEWDKRTCVLPCRNGVIDLATGELHPGRQSDYLKSTAPLEYPGIHAEAPAWEKFLLEIFGGNQETVSYLQKILGYAITGKVVEHVFIVFFGPEGRNGKSTLIGTLSHVLGQDLSGVLAVETLLAQKNVQNPAGPRPDILSLRGRRLCFSSESGEGHRLSSEKVKLLSGGDLLSARAPHAKEDITFNQTHTLFFSTNHRPQISATDKALWARIHVIPFLMRYVNDPDPEKQNEKPKDKHLPDKLKAEGPAILSWLVRGCLAWQRDGLQKPSAVEAATTEYNEAMDLVKGFYEECCIIGKDGVACKSKAGDLWTAYEAWGERVGLHFLGKRKFFERLQADFDSHRENTGTWYVGIGLKDVVQSSWRDE
jgi:putative DNA primase/helicase